jgi:hypothetical protein
VRQAIYQAMSVCIELGCQNFCIINQKSVYNLLHWTLLLLVNSSWSLLVHIGQSHLLSLSQTVMNRMTPAQADAAYAALPQAPDAAYAGHPVVPTALMEEDEPDENPNDSTRTLALDTRIRWIMFVLGAAVLLPWNGMCITSCHWKTSQGG